MNRSVPVRIVALGMGWFPPEHGGLTRYFTDLHRTLDSLPDAEAVAVVTGPAADHPSSVVVGPPADAFLGSRLLGLTRAGRRVGRGATVVDGHFALYSLLPFLTWARTKRKVVHFHGPWAAESAAVSVRGRVATRVMLAVERAVYRRADAVIVLSSAFARRVVESYGVHPGRVHVIPPGVDLGRFTPGDRAGARARFGLGDDFVGVAVRRLVPRMGLDGLLRAWAIVARDTPAARLLVAGDGPERAALERLAGDLGLADHVRFLGRVDDDELVELYRAADVSIVPSTDLEGFGLVVLEALACGAPVIASRIGGLVDALAGLEPELLVPPGDVDALATALRSVATGRAAPDAAACRAHAERFTWTQSARRQLELYAPSTPEPLRTVYVDHCARLSGGEIALDRLISALGDRVSPLVLLAEDGPFADLLRAHDVPVEVSAMDERTRDLKRDQAARPALSAVWSTATYSIRLAHRLRLLRPDLVHTNSLKAGIYGSLAARLARVPVLWHVRDRIADDYLPAPVVRFLQLAIRRLPDGAVANSHTTAATVSNAVAARPAVVVDPYDPSRDATVRPETDALTVALVGRISPWKGQSVFLRAFAEALGGTSARALLVGSAMFGEDDVERDLHALVAELGIGPQVEFRGFVEDVEGLLGTIDVLVHASTIPEPFGQVVLEGMAAGRAVVAAAAGGPAEMITDGVDGLLTPPGDIAALTAALRRLAREPELRRQLGAAASETARQYSGEPVRDRMLNVYAELTGNRPSPHRAAHE